MLESKVEIIQTKLMALKGLHYVSRKTRLCYYSRKVKQSIQQNWNKTIFYLAGNLVVVETSFAITPHSLDHAKLTNLHVLRISNMKS